MSFRILRTWGVLTLLACLALTGCANVQQPIALDQQFWGAKEPTIGVAITVLPAPELMLTGSQGLLDVAINKGVNSKLSDNVKTWEVRDLDTLPDVIVAKLQAKGYKAKRIIDQIDLKNYKNTSFREGYMTKDMTPMKAMYGVDRLLLVNVFVTGATRSYYSLVPTSVPMAQVGGQGMVVDLADNKLLWFQPFAAVQAAQGEWDEPNYANLSNAFYQAVDNSRQQMITPFSQ
ncbi:MULTISPECIES: hypothetical protein [Pseudomonas]|uniref:Lipoprotein n=1 Tax=Pseudomonas chlororaphis TaxID=587753 RepID=A0AAX3FXB5_9PSED|nr:MULTISPECIES: hypothetical protein [Pseudomonas]AVO60942.1 hypothetical protein C6Q18_24305 [Pseudomonas chlororaphis subsp. piscium]AZC39630.1 hypothetical protein C4K37_5266 [Pseudomonas chlororaphis subsp. piscium]AZC46181.1 hypothetical protein C4K36_5279 [Pseudomonas chlororaphis subsp. piscium]AZC52932.1 hypothetical protein C4K35_5372 [Pseudomonas chlororaphis subsp. piscium]AZC59187.1 hypothetical protein C4K34_5045 [Pseudomonas chlororaphis subsp. piscium]